ncbi:MAG TPA: amino acid permease [Sediminibacterium sp.]|uniref:APC family permease n=1 Tax=Sediminibacterium sp. TaxID=1917865 RepID=UPI0008B62B8F|nr:amino acid permease [Sediminibacterium sp.]MBT9483547.1 amino acid permease [Sediminibacterium sp.]OHC85657.1 MAG: amino acid transporter [Sphingobacteriia bacterium RIFOXYC2_FULL_35_18]HLD52700.1 amino acid permease [Sediminibacterium sp.]
MAETTTSFKPTLGLLDATMLVAGSMIGSGIFIVSADITRNVGSAGWLIAVWLLTGFMTLTAALSYGELSAMFPKAGGQYVYLKESYNKLTGFLYGWSFFSVIQTGTIAAVGVAFCKFAAYFFPFLEMNESDVLFLLGPFKIYPAQFVSIFIIVLLTYINTKGVQGGKMIQTVFTVTKLLSLFGLIVFGFLLGANAEVWNANWTDAWTMKSMTKGTGELSAAIIMPVLGAGALGAIAASMVGSIFSSDAWNNVTFIAGEIKNPQKNIGLSLFLGTLIVTLIYVSANLMYLSVLPLDQIAFAQSDRVAVTASNIIFGGIGTYIIAAMIMVSTFGCNNGLILAGARVYYTMAQDGLFFKKAGQLNKNAVPEWALWAQCIVASLLCLSGRYGDLLDMVSFIVVIFYVLTIAGIFILRKTRPEIPRPYKAFGYPILPAIYMLMGISFCVLLIIYKPQFTWPGLIITLLGIPLYYIAVRNAKK